MVKKSSVSKEKVRNILRHLRDVGLLSNAQIMRDTEAMGLVVKGQAVGQFIDYGHLGQQRVEILWRWVVEFMNELVKKPEIIQLLRTDMREVIEGIMRDPNGPASLAVDMRCPHCGTWTPSAMKRCGECGGELHGTNT